MKNSLIVLAAALALAACGKDPELATLRAELARQDAEFRLAQSRWEAERERMDADIAQLRGDLARVGKVDPSRPLAEVVGELSRRVAGLEVKPEPDVQARVAAIEAKLESAREAGGGLTEDRVKEMMAEKLAAEVAAAQPTKDFVQVLTRLSASEAEKEALKRSIVECKKLQLDLLQTPTEDGRVFAEEIVDAFIRVQDAVYTQADLTKLFVEIAGTKVPRDAQGRTYLQVIEEAKQKNRDRIGRLLSPQDQTRLSQAHADWSEFELGEADPWRDLFLQRFEEYERARD